MHFHGGAYVLESASPIDVAALMSKELVLALVLYLIEECTFLASAGLALPGGISLSSPSAYLGASHDVTPSPHLSRMDFVGYLLPTRGKYSHTVFAEPLGLAVLNTNRWTSPAIQVRVRVVPGLVARSYRRGRCRGAGALHAHAQGAHVG